MSSTQAEMAVLRSRIAQLEAQQKMQAALENEKRDRIAEKKDLEQKIERTKMQATLETERRDRQTRELEQKMELAKMQAALETERRDRQTKELEQKMEQKMELTKVQAALETERRDRQTKELEQKMELAKVQAGLEKKDLLHALKNEKRDRQAEIKESQRDQSMENEKRDRLLENEKRDREAEKKERTMQAQIEQLKWEARFAQMEQQVAARPYYSQQPIVSSPAPRTIAAHLTPLIQRVVESNPGETHPNPLQPSPGFAAFQAASQINTAEVFHEGGAMAIQESKATPVPLVSAALPFEPRPQASRRSQPSQLQHQESGNKQSEIIPQPQHQPPMVQHQAPTGSTIRGGAVQLPGGASNHFFLSHCQATGGDQTNAIYLELRQLGFSCW
jgi:hypothetical protein